MAAVYKQRISRAPFFEGNQDTQLCVSDQERCKAHSLLFTGGENC